MSLKMERMPCDVCGVIYSARGMTTHKRGLRCKVDTAIKRQREVGLVPVPVPVPHPLRVSSESEINTAVLESLMGHSKCRFAKDLAVYIQGDNQRSSETKMGIFVEESVRDFVLMMYRWRVEILPFALKCRLIQLAHDEEFRRAFNALSSLLEADVNQSIARSIIQSNIPSQRELNYEVAETSAIKAAETSASKAFLDLVERWGS